MTNKKAVLVFVLGAMTGWTAAQRAIGDAHARTIAPGHAEAPEMPALPAPGDSSSIAPASVFTAAPVDETFKQTVADVNSRIRSLTNPDREAA